MSSDIMSEAPIAALRDAAITREPDRYFAATLAPRAIRADLITLAAFAAELANIPAQVREPLAGEIRLQWWRDALGNRGGEVAPGHPVAVAMRATIARHTLPGEVVDAVIGSYADAVHGERPVSEPALRNLMAAGEGGLFKLAARICAGDAGRDMDWIEESAGLAYGLARALVRLPSEGTARLPIPRSLLSDDALAWAGPESESPQLAAAVGALIALARTAHDGVTPALAKMSWAKRVAFLPLAMVRPNLSALETWLQRRGTVPGEPTPIGRLLRIAWARASGRL
jgi:phytoene synthase